MSDARPRRIGGVDPLSPAKGEHGRAAITCLAETNPPWPTRLRRSKRRLRHNQERSHLPHPSRQICDPQRPLLVIIGADVVTALPRGIGARKGERLGGKGYSCREGDTRKQHSHDCLPLFGGCILSQPCHSFCDARHGMVISLGFSDACPPLPTAVVGRGTIRVLCRGRP